jgi:glycosyltransferase involved in cell wall biosynthesis
VWFGSLREPSGYADEARAYLLALDRCGYEAAAREVQWSPLEAGVSGSQLAAVERALARPVPAGDHVWVQHVVPHPSHSNHPEGRTVVRTMFETDRIPTSFRRRLVEADEVWVPDAFNVETFQRGGIPGSRLRVLPETIDFDLYAPGRPEPWPLPERRGFTFLTNFDFTDRKGWDILLDAWALAFAPDDDVCLVLKCLSLHGASIADIGARIAHHLGSRTTAPIMLEGAVLPVADLPRLYAAADAYVMASRGEGWGRPYMEAMAMGLPTIGSRWSGNLAFMDDRNAFLVDGTLVPVADSAQRHTPLYRGHRWFEPDVEALVETLRTVARGGEDVAARAAGARADLLRRFGPEVVAARLAELTEDLLARERRPPRCVWRGDFGSGHSLAVVNDGHVNALERAGVPVELRSPEAATSAADAPGVAGQWPPSFEPPSGGPFVLYQPWEFGAVPQRWVEAIRNVVDEVWAPSASVRDAYVRSGVPAALVQIVPNGVDLERFTPEGPTRALPTARGTVFLFVGGTIHRKGIDVLLDAYRRAFTAGDDVALVVKAFGGDSVYRGQTADALLAAFATDPNAPELVLLDEDVPFAELPALYRAADVLVQPYRAEGFCLPALEALACGVPPIVTAGGPTDDFVSDACGWRIAATPVAVPPAQFAGDGLTLARPGFVLEPSVDALAAALRSAADPAERAARAARTREHAERFGWADAAAAAADRLAALAGAEPVRTLAAAAVPGRRSFVFLVEADWQSPETWEPAIAAYLEAFTAADDVTLVVPGGPDALERLEAALERSGIGPDAAPDLALADTDGLDPRSLQLGADAVIHSAGAAPARARLVLPPAAAALRAVVPTLRQEAA